MNRFLPATALLFLAAASASFVERARAGQPIVPGTGEFLKDCCDDFEDPKWSYKTNLPKSSHEQDDKQRSPGGVSNNGLWHEGGKRGTPDVVKRVSTPPGGIEGSIGALMFATKNSGVPGTYSNQQMQDDLLMMFNKRLGRSIPMAWQPSCTVRVYLPEWDKWENRNGPSFGMRGDCMGREPDGTMEAYWPGMFILRNNHKNKEGEMVKAAKLTIRGDKLGRDVRSLDIDEPGWWTLGMSFSEDGQIHYYAHKGVADLTADDHLMSSYPVQRAMHGVQQLLLQRGQYGQRPHVEHAVGDRRSEDLRDPAGRAAGGAAVSHQEAAAEAAAATSGEESDAAATAAGAEWSAVGFAAVVGGLQQMPQ